MTTTIKVKDTEYVYHTQKSALDALFTMTGFDGYDEDGGDSHIISGTSFKCVTVTGPRKRKNAQFVSDSFFDTEQVTATIHGHELNHSNVAFYLHLKLGN